MIPRLKADNFQSGQFLLFDKPYGWSSFDVVKRVRHALQKYILQERIKVGHAGTLDPLATGLLILGVGAYTKRISELQEKPKTYRGVIRLGATTPSYDAETEIDHTYPTAHITEEKIRETAKQFIGTQHQYPPAHSAVKIKGERAYKKARKNQKVKVPPRQVIIHNFIIHQFQQNDVTFTLQCSIGTYARSLAYDFGQALQSGGYLAELRRLRIGEYHVKEAWQVPTYIEMIKNAAHESTS